MLPEKFRERMMRLLGDEFPAFERALTEDEPVRSFRINKIKVAKPDSFSLAFKGEGIPYEDGAFMLTDGSEIGKTPEHHCGAVYVQDPGAMATLAAVDIKEDVWAIDLCAAPGGKTSQLAARIGEDGFLISNEYVPKRAKILVGNVERLGLKNTVVTSLDTAELAKLFDGAFDVVLADVPCSGEGMFRKSSEALLEWSEENVLSSAKRQREILENAAKLVGRGGLLIYSTCTFSTEENEDNVISFLKKHSEFSLIPVSERLLPFTSPAIDTDGAFPEIAYSARRFYPHVSHGEGQFVALMQKSGSDGEGRKINFKEKIKSPTKEEALAVANFFKENLAELPLGRLVKQGESLSLIPHGGILPPYSVFCAGVMVGEVRKGILFPAHHFFSAYGHAFKRKIELKRDDTRVEAYLRGEEIPIDAELKGWCAVTFEGVTLGGAKVSSGVAKNHYPKGLRNK